MAMESSRPLRIGTRGSPLALAQAEAVRARLVAAWPALAAPGAVELAVIRTTGDKVADRALAEIGGKGLFTKEIEEALLAGAIDFAVHSMKDVPTFLSDRLTIACLLPREDPRDVLIAAAAGGIDALRQGAVVGTSSPRRQAQLLARRPDLRVVNFRGNVDTRLRKIAAGEVDATLLALAGLRRLGLADRATAILDPDEMLPAVAQGAIGVEIRADDARCRDLLQPLNDAATATMVAAERGVLERLEGSCRTPIAALAQISAAGMLSLSALIARPDGSRVIRAAREGSAQDAAALGHDAGDELRGSAEPDFFG
jgi:hydroxymethylbilane synthase